MAKKIVTDNVFPPIPIRQFDWRAFFEGEEELCHYGYGSTEGEAISELLTDYPDDDAMHASHDLGQRKGART